MSIYFPVLKHASSEITTLENLKSITKEHITPIIESKMITPTKVDEWWTTFNTLGSYLQRKIGNTKFIYDFNPAFEKIGEILESLKCPSNKNLIEHCLDKLDEANLNYVPCVHFDSPNWIIQSVLKANTKEVAVRVRCHDFNTPMEELIIERIKDKITDAKPETSFTLLLDFSNAPINPERIIKSIQNFSSLPYSNIVFISTSCPEDANGVSPISFEVAEPRKDFKIYKQLQKEFPELQYGDYTVRIKGEPDKGSNINYYNTYLKIFYTTEDDYMIGKSALLDKSGIETFVSVCEEIVNSDVYQQAEFSHGDYAINECAQGRLAINNHSKPIELGINHHIELTVKQLSSTPVFSSF